jgi:hypothetical protein
MTSTNTTKASVEKQESSVASLSADRFTPYRDELSKLLLDYRKSPSAYSDRIHAALDGQPGRQLRQVYAANLLRSTGTFFTGSGLADRLTTHLSFSSSESPLIIDPACGAGDLLVAAARKLPLRRTVFATLRFWGQHLAGIDVNSTFVETTRIRLGMLAVQRLGRDTELHDLDFAALLPHIKVGDGAASWNLPRPVTTVVVNPPFAHVTAAKSCAWSQGKTSHAAIFLERCLQEARTGAHIAAILPDVLRTGSRYQAWRRFVERASGQVQVDVVGQFDQFTDVDVFILKLDIADEKGPHHWSVPDSSDGQTVRDLFNIHVGPVVPFRLDNKGVWRTYVHSEILPAWKTVSGFSEHIRFTGKTYEPPFVLVRRTSKSSYKQRCIGTIVTGPGELAVENHLLILQPKDGKLKTCRQLLDLLQDPATSEWMNQRIRCRHLTVSAMGDLPWGGAE